MAEHTPQFDSVTDTVAAIGRGEIVVVVDDEDRENEGDLIMAAEFATPEKIAFFVRHTSGRDLRAAHRRAARRARHPARWSRDNTETQRTAFTVHASTTATAPRTGISAADRAATIQALIDPATRPGDLARPGHIFPLRYAEGGVLKRAGHTEAAVDLARMAGLYPAGVLCEIVNDDGTMARVPDLVAFAKEHDLLMISIADLIRYRRQNEKLVRRIAEARIPTEWGDFTCYVYESLLDGEQHVAIVRGAVQGEDERARPGAQRVPHRRRLRLAALRLRHPARRGHAAHRRGGPRRRSSTCAATRAAASASATRSGPTACRSEGRDTVDANLDLGLPVDSREYGIGAQILVDLGITTMRLHDQQPGQVRRPRGLRPRDHRAGAAGVASRTRRTSPTCAPSASAWATCSRASTT